MKKVVVTGMGVVSPVGIGIEDFWTSLLAGKSGAGPITRFPLTDHRTTFACEVKGFDPVDHMDRKAARRMDPFCQFAVASAKQAIDHAGLMSDAVDKNRVGVVYGSGMGGMKTFEEQVIKLHEFGPSKVSPFLVPMIIGDIAAGHISILWNFKGPNYGVQSACTTASHAVGTAFMHLIAGDADVMVCGGAEAPITSLGVSGFNSLHAISTRNDEPERGSRPFDKDRDGFVLGEGAATFILETEEHALKRGVPIIAELAGYGFSADAYHLTAPAPEGEGAVRCIQAAIGFSGISIEEIDYINAHGTSTPLNDVNETKAIKTVFGERAKSVPISSTKSMTGHLLGAAGAIELLACIQAIKDNRIPPTINLDNPDPECDLDYVPHVARDVEVKIAISNTFGFGGHNTTVVIREYEQ